MRHAQVVINVALEQRVLILECFIENLLCRRQMLGVPLQNDASRQGELEVSLILLRQDIAALVNEFLTVVNSAFNIILHVELEEVILPHKHSLRLVQVFEEQTLRLLSHLDALLERLLDFVQILQDHV